MEEFTRKYTVLDTDADLTGRMKPAALLRYAQQMATEHSRNMGMDDAFFAREHLAYLVGRQSMQFLRLPHRSETLTFTTAPEKSRRGTNKRVTVVRDEAGEEVAVADCRWILVDTRDNRIIRRPEERIEGPWNPVVERELPQTMPKAQTLGEAADVRAAYSMCDVNGHVNNTCYVDIACDAVPLEVLREHPVRSVSVRYHREVPAGSVMQVQAGEAEGGWYVCGHRDGHLAFEVFLGL